MALDLRPLTLPELLDRSFSTYKRHVWLFVGIMAVPAAFTLIYAILAEVMQFSNGPFKPGMPFRDVFWRTVPVALMAIAYLIVYLVVYAFSVGATTVAVAHIYKDQPVTVADTYRAIRPQGLRLVLLMIWSWLRVTLAGMGIMVLAGILAVLLALLSPILAVLVIIPGMFVSFAFMVYIGVRYGVAVPAAVLEDLSPNEALRRSVDLTEDYRGRIFLILLCAIAITYATAALLQGPFVVGALVAGPGTATALTLNIIGAVLGTAGSTFSGPIMIIGLAMAYYDLRIRKEALDLQMMLESIDAPRA
jgi:hypothetical protein